MHYNRKKLEWYIMVIYKHGEKSGELRLKISAKPVNIKAYAI